MLSLKNGTLKRIDVAKLATFEEIDAAWSANLGPDGRIRNLAFSRRLAARERELAISLLGMAPEGNTYETRYAATGSELRRWAEAEVSR